MAGQGLDQRQRALYDDLEALIDVALDQYDAGMAVDVERQMTELAQKWAADG